MEETFQDKELIYLPLQDDLASNMLSDRDYGILTRPFHKLRDPSAIKWFLGNYAIIAVKSAYSS